ncbi:barstar family protein [Salinispora sp. H7-4]|uniref:barstar family protein n=1 Tax=Salinispora sp. H7-4 TaxID=2748321 RepID=UPI0015D26AB1|nr:barstar family protein [Salinispora sp. H7-4]NYT96255.1 barstar family protein [Salinispora sp. H7-4]
MSAFDLDAELSGDAAFRLVAPSYVRLFWRTSVLDTVVATLREQGYQVVRLDASTWPSEADLHRDIAAALHFPDYYGHNLNALNDCLSDVVTYDYGTTPDATGLVLVFTGYDTFSRHCPRTAQVVLDIIADQARAAALFGHRVCCLVQSNDPAIRFEPVGATPVTWNDAEWLDSTRQQDRP